MAAKTSIPATEAYLRYMLVNGTREAEYRQAVCEAAQAAPELSPSNTSRVVSIVTAGRAA